MSLVRRYLVVSLLALAVFTTVSGIWVTFSFTDSMSVAHPWARAQSWLVLSVLALAMMAVPFKMVHSAGKQIEQQQRAIEQQKAEGTRLAARNEALRKLVDMIHRRGLEHNERQLRRIGSDLHDGPAQHLALVLLRLDALAPLLEKHTQSEESTTLETIRRATSDALKEIRHISSGLALPELQKISPKDALLIAVRAHQRATGTYVAATFENLPARLPLPITICLYRFAQEGLNNAFHHAGGMGQRLDARCDAGALSVEIADSGPGFVVDHAATEGGRLGLSGLRYRVESLGGTLQINSEIGQGARLAVQFRNPLA
jgi:signal transduction histidine kinase